MNKWIVEYTKGAETDLDRLDYSQSQQVIKIVRKVSQNPLPNNEGGYGKPLGNFASSELAGCCKIKLLSLGLRVVYKIVREGSVMKIIVIAARDDDKVYRIAEQRLKELNIKVK